MLSRLAVPLYGFFLIFCHTPAVVIAVTQTVLRHCIVLFRSLTVPLCSFFRVFCYTIATIIAIAQIVLRRCTALLGCPAEPLHRLSRILYHATAIYIANGKIILCFYLSLFCRLAIILNCFFIIFFDTFA